MTDQKWTGSKTRKRVWLPLMLYTCCVWGHDARMVGLACKTFKRCSWFFVPPRAPIARGEVRTRPQQRTSIFEWQDTNSTRHPGFFVPLRKCEKSQPLERVSCFFRRAHTRIMSNLVRAAAALAARANRAALLRNTQSNMCPRALTPTALPTRRRPTRVRRRSTSPGTP